MAVLARDRFLCELVLPQLAAYIDDLHINSSLHLQSFKTPKETYTENDDVYYRTSIHYPPRPSL
jgi:hypothetical protein